jgi:RNA polymerase sigma-70 factor (ECF subfamily)
VRVVDVGEAIAQVHHEQWAGLVSSLTRRFGDLDIAEEAAAEAFVTALERWPTDGLPPNPGGWLTTTANRKAIDRIRRENKRDGKQQEAWMAYQHDAPEPADATAIDDERLRLIFTCCHPALSIETRVALTLRMVGGLTVAEIARAFLVQETAMGQRITRAKTKIKAARIPYRLPSTADLPARISGVLTVLYLVFNEGYLASGPTSDPVRHELTAEAIRLTRLVRALMPDDGEVAGLLALMLLTESRRRARVSADGELVTLDQQNRASWDAALIAEGHQLVRERLVIGVAPGRYQILAAINAVHTSAPDVRDTDWSQVVALYNQPGHRDCRARRPRGGTGGHRGSREDVGRLPRIPRHSGRFAASAGPQSGVANSVRQGDRTDRQHRRNRLPDPAPRRAAVVRRRRWRASVVCARCQHRLAGLADGHQCCRSPWTHH